MLKEPRVSKWNFYRVIYTPALILLCLVTTAGHTADRTISGFDGGPVIGDDNTADDSSGGSNTLYITPTGDVGSDVIGSRNIGVKSSGGSNSILIDPGGNISDHAMGSQNIGVSSSGGSNSINNSGTTGEILGSDNVGDNSSGGSNIISNSGTVHDFIFGSYNLGDNSSGGSNRISNSGSVGLIFGSLNEGSGSSGGSNTISNSGTAGLIIGSYNFPFGSSGGFNRISNSGIVEGIVGSANGTDNSSGGSNTITNSGSADDIFGSDNHGDNSSGGSNTITNSGSADDIFGSDNHGVNSSGGFNTITNSGSADDIFGSDNHGVNSSGGSNRISNSGTVEDIYGSDNHGDGSSGGSNTISNSGTVDEDITGSDNHGDSSSGGANTITNSGTVTDDIWGSHNAGDHSSGGANTIINSGSVDRIYGSDNTGDNSSGGSNTISNSGTADRIYGSYNEGDDSNGGSNTISNSGTVDRIYGSYNKADGSSGDSNTISNSGTADRIYGSYNEGDNSTGGSNTITNSGEVERIYGSYNPGDSSSGGSNTISNSGAVERIYGSYNRGDNSSGGANTISNSGTVEKFIGSYNAGDGSSGGANSIENSGTVEGDIFGSYNEGDGSTSTGNTITNSGSVTGDIWGSFNSGAGSSGGDDTITNSGEVQGSIYGEDGNDTVILVGGSSLGGVADGGPDNDTLGLNNMGTVDGSLLGTTYLNFENLGIYGGSNTLTGTWDFSGGTTMIYAGDLFVAGTLSTSSFTIYPDGFLGGNGTINGAVVNYGTISPGNSIGTLSIVGSLDFMPGSTYEAELAASGASDLIQVTGPVTISGGTLRTSLQRALYTDGFNWTIIKASGGVSGTFPYMNIGFTSSTIALRQRIQGGSLQVYIDRTPYETFGSSSNDAAIGKSLDMLLPQASGAMEDMLIAMDFDLDASQISATLAGLNPQIYTAFPSVGLESAGIFNRAANLHQQEMRLAAAYPSEDRNGPLWNGWFRALGSRFDRDPNPDMPGYEMDTGGVVFGAERNFGTETRAGLLLGYSDGDLSWDGAAGNGEIKAKHIGLYGSTEYDNFYFDGSAGYTSLDNNGTRLIQTPLFTTEAEVGSDSDAFGASLTGGYNFLFEQLRIGPAVSFGYLRLDQDGFSERIVNDIGITVDSSEAESLISSLGARLEGLYEAGDWRFLPRGELSWLHQFKDDPVELSAAFTGYGDAPFTVVGAPPPGDQALLNIGLAAEYGTSLTLNADYSIAASDEQKLQLLSIGMAWLF